MTTGSTRQRILQALGNAGRMDQAAAFVKLCWGPMLRLGKGCFWALFSPEWETWMNDGDKAPTSPPYCHPWASGVTHWLSEAAHPRVHYVAATPARLQEHPRGVGDRGHPTRPHLDRRAPRQPP